MSKKMVLQYFDDLDGAPLDVEDLNAVDWSWAGVNYHFDTSTTNLELIEAGRISVGVLLDKSLRIDMGRASASGGGVAAPANTVTPAGAAVGEVRSWALANHYNGVGMRGRLSQNIIEAYNRAH